MRVETERLGVDGNALTECHACRKVAFVHRDIRLRHESYLLVSIEPHGTA